MSGNAKSKIEENRQKITDWLGTKFNSEVREFLNLTGEKLRKLSPLDCNIASCVLASQSFYIQKEVNKLVAENKGLENNINSIISPFLKNFDKFTPYIERRFLATQDNDVAKQYNEELKENEQKIEALAFLATRIENLSRTMLELKRVKYDQNGS